MAGASCAKCCNFPNNAGYDNTVELTFTQIAIITYSMISKCVDVFHVSKDLDSYFYVFFFKESAIIVSAFTYLLV